MDTWVIMIITLRVAAAHENLADVPCGYQWGRGGQDRALDLDNSLVRAAPASRIVGGQSALRGEFPWLVSITRSGGHFCGGTLVTRTWVLTAAHCLCSGSGGGSELVPAEQLKVVIGQHDLREKDSSALSLRVERALLHPGYECKRFLHDVALLRLAEEVKWADSTWPACLPSGAGTKDFTTYSGREATAAGWGWTNEHSNKGGRADVLQKVELHVLDNTKCRDWYKSQGKQVRIHDSQLCAGFESGGRDSCWADSGGPLMVVDGGRVTVVGVVSTGIGCARPKLPGLYTRVSDYVPWIQEQVKES